ncbi:MAG: CAP domain-containing protein [Patescibacteria group bacterium]
MPKRILKKIHHYTIPHEGNEYKPHSLRHGTLVFYSVFLIAVKLIVGFGLLLSYPTHGEFSTITANRIIELTNRERVEQNLAQLETSEILNQTAALKLHDMFDNDYFAHNSPNGIKPWYWFKEAGYNYTYAGENLAMNFIEAEDAMNAWMNSPSHRDNIVSKNYKEIGVAVGIGKIDGEETTVVVQVFGKRYVRIAGEESFRSTAKEITPTEVGDKKNTVVTEQASQQQVTFKQDKTNSWISTFIKYSNKIFFVLFIFLIINLLLTIFIRLEIQHKPIIIHSIFVIALTATMILWKVHFMEGMGDVLVI